MMIPEGNRNYGKPKIKGKITWHWSNSQKSSPEKAKNRQRGKLATKREGPNPHRINPKRNIES